MKLLLAVAALAIASYSQLACAQTSFPAKTLTVVNPNAPGGTSDIIGHGMSESLRQALRQPVVMVSRVGAGGAVGGAYVAQAPADGYTVLLNTVTHVLIPITDSLFGRSSGYTTDDFLLLARITADPLILVVHPSIPGTSVKDLVAYAKAKPDTLIFSSTGLYGSAHLTTAMLMRSADVKLVHSPFNGAGPAMTAVLGNHANMFFAPAGVASPHMQSGRVRALAQTGSKRVPLFPDLPTLREAGYDVELTLWAGFFAHSKTPATAVKTWQAALRESAQDPRFRDAMAKISVTVDYLDGEPLKAWYDEELKRLDREIRTIGKLESRT
jgi:tripartite-type tricarboxylate transporter receptor subunit TctC